MSPVKAADPDARGLDEAFNSAMGSPPKPHEPAAPADVDPDAPVGRGEAGAAIAPFGTTKDGRPRRSAAGRRPKDEQPRIATAQSESSGSAAGAAVNAAAPEGRDYTAALADFGDTAWFGLSAVAKGGSAIPLVGRFIPERKLAAQAFVLRSYKPTLVKAVNLAAQHNARAARFAATIEGGDITWAVTVGLLVLPFVTMSAALWRDSEDNPALAKAELPSIAELADKNDAVLDQYLSQLSEQLETMVAEQTAEALAELNGQAADEQLAAAREAGIL